MNVAFTVTTSLSDVRVARYPIGLPLLSFVVIMDFNVQPTTYCGRDGPARNKWNRPAIREFLNASAKFQITVAGSQSENVEDLIGTDGDALVAIHVEGDGIRSDVAPGLKIPQRFAGTCIQSIKVAFIGT